jgi:hypothetical protein
MAARTDDNTRGGQMIDDGDQQQVFLSACGSGKEPEKVEVDVYAHRGVAGEGLSPGTRADGGEEDEQVVTVVGTR